MARRHELPVRVYYEDTDFSGFVYHANYLRFLERGRSEFLRELGIHHRSLFEGEALGFVVQAMDIAFRKPALMDDELRVETHLLEVRGASARMEQRVLRGGEVLVAALVRVALVREGRPARFPEDLRAKLSAVLDDQPRMGS